MGTSREKLKVNRNNDLLKFLLGKKIPLWKAIEILEYVEKKQGKKWKAQEKAILPKYETR